MQDISYTYNERGWLATSSAPLFAMQLYYNTGTNKGWNGNIMYQWSGVPGNLANHYSYKYDKLNRILSGTSTGMFNETGITYDLNGNIATLKRTNGSSTVTDDLAYTYTSSTNPTNQLQSITDATTSDVGLKHGTFAYTYDGNGNQLTDPAKGPTGITLSYNLLNLPQTVTGSKAITYTYGAAGQKLRRVSTTATGGTGKTDYISGIQYDDNNSGTETLSFIQTEEGKAVPATGGSYNYTYYLGDQLGNTRVTFDTQSGSAGLLQTDNYYPFGMEQTVGTIVSTKNEYLYNKKELQEELGEYDYGARFYDPVIGRWNTIDPLAEISRRWSPYNYVENNPIRHTDPDGMACDGCKFNPHHDPDDPDHGNMDDFSNDNHAPDHGNHPNFDPGVVVNHGVGYHDKYKITDGGIERTEKNTDNHNDFYGENNQYLFSMYSNPLATGPTVQGSEGAQGLEDFTSYIANHPSFALELLNRANATGWDASESVIAAVRAGGTENGYKKFWDIASFTPWGAFYDENAMKGKQRDFIGLASSKVDFISKVYSLFTSGSLQYDIAHGQISTPPQGTTDNTNVFSRMWDTLIKGIADINGH